MILTKGCSPHAKDAKDAKEGLKNWSPFKPLRPLRLRREELVFAQVAMIVRQTVGDSLNAVFEMHLTEIDQQSEALLTQP